uniref:WD repeat-containing protein 74 n=1 Tax=Timema tahoe TaxID=61484 RepID=A0A7R9NVV1_9NEOP|nr:unnamed protein product [Timema tahoe]
MSEMFPIKVTEDSLKLDFNVYVGSETGPFKGVHFRGLNETPIYKNILALEHLVPSCYITAMNWADVEENNIMLATINGNICVYESRKLKNFNRCLPTDTKHGRIMGVSEYEGAHLTAFDSGVVKNWVDDEKDQLLLDAGKNLKVMLHSQTDRKVIATGGSENQLRLWDLNEKKCTFEAKNIRPDELQLRVGVDVSGITFLSNNRNLATCSKYGFANIYNPGSQRRPVISTKVPDNAFSCITTAPNENHVVVGSGVGNILLIDLRKTNKIVSKYKGCSGCVTAIACHKTEPYIVSLSLDRCLRVHNLNTTALVHKVHMVSPLNFLLVRSDFSFEKSPSAAAEDMVAVESDSEDIFKDLEKVEDKPRKKRKLTNA